MTVAYSRSCSSPLVARVPDQAPGRRLGARVAVRIATAVFVVTILVSAQAAVAVMYLDFAKPIPPASWRGRTIVTTQRKQASFHVGTRDNAINSAIRAALPRLPIPSTPDTAGPKIAEETELDDGSRYISRELTAALTQSHGAIAAEHAAIETDSTSAFAIARAADFADVVLDFRVTGFAVRPYHLDDRRLIVEYRATLVVIEAHSHTPPIEASCRGGVGPIDRMTLLADDAARLKSEFKGVWDECAHILETRLLAIPQVQQSGDSRPDLQR